MLTAGSDAPATHRWGLTAGLLDAAFPFHLVLDGELRIRQAGRSLRRLFPDLADGTPLATLFEVAVPRVPAGFAAYAALPRELFLLQGRADAGLTLRGQMLHDDAAGVLIFAGSPWVNDTSAFAGLGLTLGDLAVSDPAVDYAVLLQTQNCSLAEAKELAGRLEQTARELRHQAYHDALTGLPNRTSFTEHLSRTLDHLDAAAGGDVDVIMLDLDGFKAVNDGYGHAAGDELLKILADRLRQVAADVDLIARFGGDEFVFLVGPAGRGDSSGKIDGAGIAEVILAAVREPVTLVSRPDVCLRVGASVGIAARRGRENADELIRNADLAMYAAKNAGKGRCQHYQDHMHATALARAELIEALRSPSLLDQLVLHYQPIVETASGEVTGVEALVRWRHPQRGLVPPDEFISLAESTAK